MEGKLTNINIYRFLLKMFLSSFKNRIDKKGRVSVPATFRSFLSSMGYNGFISYPSFNHNALEACSQDRIERLSSTIDSLNPFEERRDFATSILSESENLQFDTEGRVSLSDKQLDHAKIKSNVLFVGLGKTFQIWEPKILKDLKQLQKKHFKIDLILNGKLNKKENCNEYKYWGRRVKGIKT